MKIFALSDPHLALATPGKEMDRFGEQWVNHPQKIAAAWRECVGAQDLVLVPGDISWAMRLPEARADLEFLGSLPGRKVLVKGNHDYWWASHAKVKGVLPPGIDALQADALQVGEVLLAGTRLWDLPDTRFGPIIDWQPTDGAKISPEDEGPDTELSRKIFRREVSRLTRALQGLAALKAPEGLLRIALTHYPPVGPDLAANEITELFETHRIRHAVFGHLHAVRQDLNPPPFGERAGVRYHLASCDYLEFRPRFIDEV